MVVVVGATGRCSGWFAGKGVGRVCVTNVSALRIGAEVHEAIQMRIRVRLMTAVVTATVGWR